MATGKQREIRRVAFQVISYLDYHRTRKVAVSLSDEIAQRPEQNHDHSDEEWRELGKRVLPMIETLPEVYRAALLLSEIDELPPRGVAERLNLSLPGAKSRVQRGRERLERAFLDCCHFKFDCQGAPIDWHPRENCARISC
jgi:RNA polymerase sigma-70 factor, ECF subfamily